MRSFSMLVALIGVLLLSPGAASAEQACPRPDHVRILPAGDSITFGALPVGNWHEMAGYRYPLGQLLAADGYVVDFVGPWSNGPGGWANSHHGGGVGWRIEDLRAVMTQWVLGYRPHIVLLMIGTNNLIQNDPTGSAAEADKVGPLLDQIEAASPCTETIVSQIPQPTDVGGRDPADAYNARLMQIADARASSGHRVHPQSLSTVSISSDQVHPDDAGYLSIAQSWRGSIGARMPQPFTVGALDGPPTAPVGPALLAPTGTVQVAWPPFVWSRLDPYVGAYAVYDYPDGAAYPLWWLYEDPDAICDETTCAVAAPWPLPIGHHFLFVIARGATAWGAWSAPGEFCVATC